MPRLVLAMSASPGLDSLDWPPLSPCLPVRLDLPTILKKSGTCPIIRKAICGTPADRWNWPELVRRVGRCQQGLTAESPRPSRTESGLVRLYN
jgi:hypothetical protein